MSFRTLKEETYLVLQVKEGHGFGFATHPLIITANLVGNIHESFITEPSPQPKFENEFVWVMEKTKLKSIWTDKVPVRIECFTVNNSYREKIGYIILNVKDAQIIHEKIKIKETQTRLLGLSKGASLLKPELLLSFYITDVPIKGPQLTPLYSPRLENNRIQMCDRPLRVMLGSGKEHFSISIEVHSTCNLNELLPSGSQIEPAEICYSYHLLGADIVSDASTHHRARVNITSSLATLKTYFLREPTVAIKLFLDSLLVGETSINMENLILSEEFYTKKSKHQPRAFPCHCEVTPSLSLTEGLSPSKVIVDFVLSFACEASILKNKTESSEALPQLSVGSKGDPECDQVLNPPEHHVTPPLTTQPHGSETYRTQPSVTSSVITITIIQLHLEAEAPSQCYLRINHPGGSVMPQQLLLPVSWSSQQFQLTISLSCRTLEPCTLLLMSEGQMYAQAVLSPPSDLFSTPKTKPSEQTEVLTCESKRVGEVRVSWCLGEYLLTSTVPALTKTVSTLTDSSLSPPPTLTKHNDLISTIGIDVMSPRSRELKILSFVEELEDWAEKQRILVMEGLKEEEAVRMSQWESEVGGQVVEGRQLVEALQNMRDQLRDQETALCDNQRKLKVYKEELERVHRNKLQEFKEMSRRMQDEFNHKLALIASDKAALEREVEKLREENVEIKQRMKEIQSRADTDRQLSDNLTHDMKMIKEKLSMEQESKKFFKEHCRKAEQEIHRLNCLRQQELESRIFNEKKTFEELAFQQIVVEKNGLRQDQKLLNEIRQQLLHRSANADINFSYANRPVLQEKVKGRKSANLPNLSPLETEHRKTHSSTTCRHITTSDSVPCMCDQGQR